jgi:hypothetical protein
VVRLVVPVTAEHLAAAAEVASLVGAAGFALLLIGLPRVLESWQATRQVAEQQQASDRPGAGTWFPGNAPYERRYADPGSRPSNELHTGPSRPRPYSAAHATPVRDGDPGE